MIKERYAAGWIVVVIHPAFFEQEGGALMQLLRFLGKWA